MVFFGHIGITLAAAKVIEKSCLPKTSIDYRIVLLGSILPDLIDKTVGRVFFNDMFSSGRLFAHTLLFVVVLFLAALFLGFKWGNKQLLVISGCVAFHQLCDSMWRFPPIWMWPYWGSFPRIGTTDEWLHGVLQKLFSDPAYYLPELIGLGVLLYYLIQARTKLGTFIKSGRMD